MRVRTGSAYGGGSIVYGGLLVRPREELFDRIFPPSLRYRDMQPYYDRVAGMLGIGTVPEDILQEHGIVILEPDVPPLQGVKGAGCARMWRSRNRRRISTPPVNGAPNAAVATKHAGVSQASRVQPSSQ